MSNKEDAAREFSRLIDTYKDIVFTDSKESNIKRENANIDGNTSMGAMLKFGSEGAKRFNSMFVLPEKIAKGHESGDFHIHDFDFYTLTTTCTQIDLLKLFKGGFHTGHGFLREPNDIISYAALCCIAIQSNQNDQHGGQAIVNFDYSMAPGVAKTFVKKLIMVLDIIQYSFSPEEIKKACSSFYSTFGSLLCEDAQNALTSFLKGEHSFPEERAKYVLSKAMELTDKDTHQAMEALIHNLNTMHSRAGAQVPFSSLNYGMCTSPEARMAIKNILLATEEGLGGGETPIFPIQIFRVKEGINFNPGEPNYDLFKLACECSAKRLFPNFSFQDSPFNAQYYKPGHPETEIAYMGCRTRVIGNVADPEKEVSNGRGNLSFTTINLPRLAIRAVNEKKDEHNGLYTLENIFFNLLEEQIQLVKEQLLHRYKIQCAKKAKNYPFLMGNGVWIDSDTLSPEDTLEEVLKHGTLSIGFIGLAETLKELTGKHQGESEESQKLGLEIIGFIRKRCDDFSKEYNLNFTCLATPAEGLSGRFVKLDKEKYGAIPGVTDREYYTNSFHIPVYSPISVWEKIRLEAPYHALTNAGHISYVELDGDPLQNLPAFESIIRYMHDCGMGYGSINHPVDHDPVCGYTGIIGDICPRCGRRDGESVSSEKLEEIRKKYPNMPTHFCGCN